MRKKFEQSNTSGNAPVRMNKVQSYGYGGRN